MADSKLMKDIYNDLNALNNDLITEYKIRCQNHNDLVESLKKVNIIIQRAANLRGNPCNYNVSNRRPIKLFFNFVYVCKVGKAKSNLINSCRNAIQQNNFNLLSRIISEGQY